VIDTRFLMPRHLQPYVTAAEANEVYIGCTAALVIVSVPLGLAPWADAWWGVIVNGCIGAVICYVPAMRLMRRAQCRRRGQDREGL